MDFLKRIFGKGKSQKSVFLMDVTVVIGNGFTPGGDQIGHLLVRGDLQATTNVKEAQAQWNTLADGKEKVVEIGMHTARKVVNRTIRKDGCTLEDLPAMKVSVNSVKLPSGAEFLILYFPLARAAEELRRGQIAQQLFR